MGKVKIQVLQDLQVQMVQVELVVKVQLVDKVQLVVLQDQMVQQVEVQVLTHQVQVEQVVLLE